MPAQRQLAKAFRGMASKDMSNDQLTIANGLVAAGFGLWLNLTESWIFAEL